MDVSKTIGPATTLNGGKKLAPEKGWSTTLNLARGITKPSHLSTKLGVAHEPSPQDRKLSESTLATARETFAGALDKATSDPPPLSEEKKASLEKSSATLVNQFFMGSMLKQMRSSPFKVDSLSGGKGGDAYAGLFDQNIAEHAGNGIAKSLVKSMVKQYARTGSGISGVSAGVLS